MRSHKRQWSRLGAVLLCGIGGCSPGFWSSYGVVNPQSCPALMAACAQQAGLCTADQIAQACGQVTSLSQTTVDTRLHKDVDILFLIDNSPSMSPKQRVLAQAIPGFISKIEATNANYHVGIVTSDLGFNVPNGTATGQPFPGQVMASCNTAAGDDGVLQNIPCTNRSGLSGEAASACVALCPDPSFVPNSGARYISKQDGVTNVPQRMMGGMDVGPQAAFQCMALVGDIGCGVEMQLESVKRALDNHRPDNLGFNRGTSVLAVIFITDEDDCSVQLSKRNLLNPATPMEATAACTTPTPTPGVSPACFDVDYRCIATDITCTEPMNTTGKKNNCTERSDTIMNSLDQYVNFFSGLPNPNIILAGIWTPTLLDNVLSDPNKDGQLYVDLVNQGSGTARLNRGQGSAVNNEAACYTPDPQNMLSTSPFFGQAQLRLSSFIRRFQANNISEHSVCDATATSPMGGYPHALNVIADNIANSFGADCTSVVPKTTDGKPECVVGYVDATEPLATPATLLPVCSAKCCNYFATDSNPKQANDPNLNPNPHLQAEMTACGADPDCYCTVPSTVNCLNSAVAGVWRAGNAAPPAGQVVDFRCAGAASSP